MATSIEPKLDPTDWAGMAPNSPSKEGWQPIETAPKDGTTILMGKWHDGERYWMASGCIEDGKFWCDFPDDYFVPFSHQNPTHWRPLPDPPSPL